MRKNLIYLSCHKLYGIDRMSMIFLELKARYPKTNIIFILRSDKQKKEFMLQTDMWPMIIDRLGATIYVMRGKTHLVTVWRVLRFLVQIAFRRNIICQDSEAFPCHKLTMKVVKKISNTTEVKMYMAIMCPGLLRYADFIAEPEHYVEPSEKKCSQYVRNWWTQQLLWWERGGKDRPGNIGKDPRSMIGI